MKSRFFRETPQGFSQTVLDIPTHWNHSLSHLDFHRLPMDFLWLSHGCPSISKWMSMAFPWMSLPWISMDFNGSSMDFCRISHRLPMDFLGSPWISHGFPMDLRWFSDGFPWISKWMSMAFPWMSMDFSWISMDFHRFPWIPMDVHVFLWQTNVECCEASACLLYTSDADDE